MTDMRGTTVTAASGSPLAVSRYRMGSNLLAPTAPVSTGAVCLLGTTLESVWGGSVGSIGGAEAGRPSTVRKNSDFTKPRHGSQASDGTG